jgi:hypothetical protein
LRTENLQNKFRIIQGLFFQSYSIFSVVKPKAFKDTNNALNNAERWYEGKLLGPEHLLAKGKFIYATLGTGEVVRLDGENVTHVIRFGEPCRKLID